jgi:hypothetical protein
MARDFGRLRPSSPMEEGWHEGIGAEGTLHNSVNGNDVSKTAKKRNGHPSVNQHLRGNARVPPLSPLLRCDPASEAEYVGTLLTLRCCGIPPEPHGGAGGGWVGSWCTLSNFGVAKKGVKVKHNTHHTTPWETWRSSFDCTQQANIKQLLRALLMSRTTTIDDYGI